MYSGNIKLQKLQTMIQTDYVLDKNKQKIKELYCKSATTRALQVDQEASPLVPREGDMM